MRRAKEGVNITYVPSTMRFISLPALLGVTNAFSPPHHISPHEHNRLGFKLKDTSKLGASLSPAVHCGLVASSVGILGGYHIHLFQKERKSDTTTWRQYQAATREEWARHVRDTEGWLYAIQSLRNAMTAQSFLASTVLSLLTLITGRMWDILRRSTLKWERRLLTAQLASVSATMLFSAYQFLQGVRLMTHAGFMFPVNKHNTKVDKIMQQTQNCQWLGLRWMYISLAPISWVVGGPRALFAVACLLLHFFRSLDREPDGLGYEEFQGMNI